MGINDDIVFHLLFLLHLNTIPFSNDSQTTEKRKSSPKPSYPSIIGTPMATNPSSLGADNHRTLLEAIIHASTIRHATTYSDVDSYSLN